MADQNDKLRRLRDHLKKAEWWPTTGIVEVIDSLLAEDEPTIREDRKVADQPTDDRDDELLVGSFDFDADGSRPGDYDLQEFLRIMEDRYPMGLPDHAWYDRAFVEVVRRALSSSPSRHVRGDQP